MPSKPQVFLEDVNFDFEKGDGGVSYDPHIAYTLPSQNGAASGLNKPFILKSDELEISEEDMETIDKIQEEVLKGYNSKRMRIERALRKAYPMMGDDYHSGYQYMHDFDDKNAYFNMKDKYYMMPYTMKGTEVMLADMEPMEVEVEERFVPVMNQDMSNEEMMAMMAKAMPEFMTGLVMGMMKDEAMMKQMMPYMGDVMPMMKASASPEDNSEVQEQDEVDTSDVIKGETQMPDINIEEILKSEAAQEILKTMVKAQTAEYEEIAKDAQAKLKAKEEQEVLKAKSDLTEVVKGWSVIEDEKTEAIVKAIFGNDEAGVLIEAFQAYEDKLTEVKKSFGETEHGMDAGHEPQTVNEKAVSAVDAILKAQKKTK